MNNEGEKFFSALRADGSALLASMHCLPQYQSQYKIASYGPAQYQHPPFNIPTSALYVYTYTATDSNISKNVNYTIFLLVAPPCKKSYVRP